MKSTRNSLGLIILAFFLIFASGCKSKKKAMEAAAEKARIEQEAKLRQQEEDKRMKEAEEKAKMELAAQQEAERKAAEAAAAATSTPKSKLNQYFDSISGASSVASANSSINEALAMFSSPDTPVLIIISESNGQKDYDKPTTIKGYLNYLKDQRKNINRIESLQFDSAGKIKEVELRK
ncbi:MAG: nucleoid-structuring protein H-NS [Cyclobacteriaceae bacterium]|nr:nucleoid-structuring protein H-NS [Cyclobacteriaceae bacterium]